MHQPRPRPAARETTPTLDATRAAVPPARVLAAVFAGGVIGAGARVGLAMAFPVHPGRFPWTTMGENIAGAFLLGLVLARLLASQRPGPDLRPFLCTGMLGSFTTFSNYTVETLTLGGERPWLAGLYAAGSVAAGLAAAWAGARLGRGGRL